MKCVPSGRQEERYWSPPSRRRGLKLHIRAYPPPLLSSPPSRRRGLKYCPCLPLPALQVASFAEAWIEILSPPYFSAHFRVASFAEAWIEIKRNYCSCFCFLVASFAEAWIEILNASPGAFFSMSPPSRRRGLKLYDSSISRNTLRRLLRGGVD